MAASYFQIYSASGRISNAIGVWLDTMTVSRYEMQHLLVLEINILQCETGTERSRASKLFLDRLVSFPPPMVGEVLDPSTHFPCLKISIFSMEVHLWSRRAFRSSQVGHLRPGGSLQRVRQRNIYPSM